MDCLAGSGTPLFVGLLGQQSLCSRRGQVVEDERPETAEERYSMGRCPSSVSNISTDFEMVEADRREYEGLHVFSY